MKFEDVIDYFEIFTIGALTLMWALKQDSPIHPIFETTMIIISILIFMNVQKIKNTLQNKK